jgi:hypothetical protein
VSHSYFDRHCCLLLRNNVSTANQIRTNSWIIPEPSIGYNSMTHSHQIYTNIIRHQGQIISPKIAGSGYEIETGTTTVISCALNSYFSVICSALTLILRRIIFHRGDTHTGQAFSNNHLLQRFSLSFTWRSRPTCLRSLIAKCARKSEDGHGAFSKKRSLHPRRRNDRDEEWLLHIYTWQRKLNKIQRHIIKFQQIYLVLFTIYYFL